MANEEVQNPVLEKALTYWEAREKEAEALREKNAPAILAALKDARVTSVSVTYSGAGDSGCIDRVEFYNADNQKVKCNTCYVTVSESQSKFDHKSGKWNENIVEIQTNLDEAIHDFASSWLDTLYGGWENNDGAQGEFTVDVKSGKFKLRHEANRVEFDVYEHELGESK